MRMSRFEERGGSLSSGKRALSVFSGGARSLSLFRASSRGCDPAKSCHSNQSQHSFGRLACRAERMV